MTPTEDFVIDHWPGDPRVAFASACSGHGFKFAPLTGRILADCGLNGRADFPGARTWPRSLPSADIDSRSESASA